MNTFFHGTAVLRIICAGLLAICLLFPCLISCERSSDEDPNSLLNGSIQTGCPEFVDQ